VKANCQIKKDFGFFWSRVRTFARQWVNKEALFMFDLKPGFFDSNFNLIMKKQF
jgi:hypothetical protein